ncbi:hypothetical protein EI94DRAFT_1707601 [Lactarius quietus]|nr:hypothetical protein EI94DRAFT_1707601 [Lactarius quietus]
MVSKKKEERVFRSGQFASFKWVYCQRYSTTVLEELRDRNAEGNDISENTYSPIRHGLPSELSEPRPSATFVNEGSPSRDRARRAEEAPNFGLSHDFDINGQDSLAQLRLGLSYSTPPFVPPVAPPLRVPNALSTTLKPQPYERQVKCSRRLQLANHSRPPRCLNLTPSLKKSAKSVVPGIVLFSIPPYGAHRFEEQVARRRPDTLTATASCAHDKPKHNHATRANLKPTHSARYRWIDEDIEDQRNETLCSAAGSACHIAILPLPLRVWTFEE